MNLLILSVCYALSLVTCDDAPPYFMVSTKQTLLEPYYEQLAGLYCKTNTKTEGRFYAYQLETGEMYLLLKFGRWHFKETLDSSSETIEFANHNNQYPGDGKASWSYVIVDSVWDENLYRRRCAKLNNDDGTVQEENSPGIEENTSTTKTTTKHTNTNVTDEDKSGNTKILVIFVVIGVFIIFLCILYVFLSKLLYFS